MLSRAANTSTTAKVLNGFGQSLLRWGKGSWAAFLIHVDWGLTKWLAGSQVAQELAWLGTKLQQVAWKGAWRWRTAWEASFVGRGYMSWQLNEERTGRFWSGLLFGLAAGTLVLGYLMGTLTHRRLLTAAVLFPISILFFVLPVNLSAWIAGSRFVAWMHYVINLGLNDNSL